MQRIDAAVGAAGQHDVGVAAGDQAERLADRLRAGGAGGRDRAVGPLGVEGQRDVGRHHVRQVLQDPQREQAAWPRAGRAVSVSQFAVRRRRSRIRCGVNLGQVDRHQAGAHDDADAFRVFAFDVEAASCTARPAAPTAKRMARPMILRLLR